MNNTLIFLRHGKTKVTGDKPVSQWDLSGAGFAQSETLASEPEFQAVDIIIVSGEEKAYQTALPIAKAIGREGEIIREPQISELDRDKGGFLDHETYEKASRDTLMARDVSVHDWETANHALERFSKAIEEIERRYEGKKILIVGHGMTMNLYFAKVLGELDKITERFAGNTFCDWGVIKDGKVIRDLAS
jgi:broad specificity phosphatase PhoE